MTDLEVVEAVIELFEGHPERWTKDAYARTENGNVIGPREDNAVSWCLLGAFDKFGDQSTTNDITYLLSRLVRAKGSVDFNDDPNTTFEDFMNALYQTRDTLEQYGSAAESIEKVPYGLS